jgi:hypothetical protein
MWREMGATNDSQGLKNQSKKHLEKTCCFGSLLMIYSFHKYNSNKHFHIEM